jgi:hypothetical protein
MDHWIGLRLMHPPIVWVCQRAGISQYAFYRYSWWTAALLAVWLDANESKGFLIFDVLFALVRTLSAGINPDRPARSPLFIRVVLTAILLIDVGGIAVVGKVGAFTIGTALALIGEYAATITTIPPRKKPEPKQSARLMENAA